jgi:alpha-mannosidase
MYNVNMNIGTRVKVVETISQRDYTNEGHIDRLKFIGKTGIVIQHHDSHGLCYDVNFLRGKATYDPDELIEVPF